MSTTIGRVDFLVDFDGKKLPSQARKAGREVGTAMGREASNRFDIEMSGVADRLKNQMKRDGEFLGLDFSKALRGALISQRSSLSNALAGIFSDRDSFNNFVSGSDSVGDGVNRVTQMMEKLRREGGLTWNQFQSLNKTTRDWSKGLFESEAESERLTGSMVDLDRELKEKVTDTKKAGAGFDGLNKRLKENKKATDDNGSAWKNLSHNLRQAILIVAAVAAGSGQIAVLGSAAGVGLTILGGAALAAGAGLGVLIAALQGVGGEIKSITALDKLLAKPLADRTTADTTKIALLQKQIAGFNESVFAINKLKFAFKGLQDRLQLTLLTGAAPVIASLTKLVDGPLGDGLNKIAQALNDSLLPMLDGLSSNVGGAKLGVIFGDMSSQVEDLVQAIGFLGGGIGNLLIIAGPFITRFTAGFKDMLDKFDQFTGSVSGNQEIQDWFANGTLILDKFNKLVGAAGKVLAALVTPKSVKQTADFLDNLTGAMPFLQSLLEVFGQLDIFGLAAKFLNDIGKALQPVLDLLDPVAQILNEVIVVLITGLAGALDFIGILLQPIILEFKIFAYLLQPLVDYITQVAVAMQGLMTPLNDVANNIFEGLKPALDRLITSFTDLLPSPAEMARVINEQVLPAIQDFADWLTTEGIQALSDTADALAFVVTSLHNLVDTQKKLQTFADKFGQLMHEIANAIKDPIGELKRLIQLQDLLNLGNGNNFTVGQVPHAAGGIVNSATFLGHNVAGEAGPEAIVPLMRDLNQVDPSVRWLSAIAQGKAAAGGGGKTLNVDAGAIVVVEATDARQTANAVLDRFVALTGV